MSRKSKKATQTVESSLLKSIDSSQVTRRTFLKVSAGTAAVAGVTALALESRSFAQTSPSATASQAATDPFALVPVKLTINGKSYSANVEPRAMLVNVLRETFNLTGTKRPCNRQECGGCTVMIDGRSIYSCTYLAVRASGHQITTVEGGSADPVLAALQTAWVPADASQCGYCQPGRLMAATALLHSNPNPSVDEIKAGLEGVLCRCGTYLNAITAVQAAAKALGGS